MSVSIAFLPQNRNYYVELQTQCDNGEHPEMLTIEGAVEALANSEAWYYETDMSNFEAVEAAG